MGTTCGAWFLRAEQLGGPAGWTFFVTPETEANITLNAEATSVIETNDGFVEKYHVDEIVIKNAILYRRRCDDDGYPSH